jgi:hypothetical protein
LNELCTSDVFSDFILSETLEAIEEAIETSKTEAHIINISNYRFKITINRDQFKSAINNVLKKYEKEENYDKCIYLTQLIKKI